MLLTIATSDLLLPHAFLIQNNFALVRTYGVVMFMVIDVVTTMFLVVVYLITSI
jgi:hypothetical protein